MDDDKIMKQLKESWDIIENDEAESELAWQLNRLGFSDKKLAWMLEKVSAELQKERDKTRQDRSNSSLEVILTDVQKLLFDIIQS